MATNLKKIKPMTIILIGAIIAIIGGLVSAVGTWMHNKQSSEKSTRIETGVNKANEEVLELQKQNDSLNLNLEIQLNKIDDLRQENNELSSKLFDESIKIYKNITGDGNKPILIIGASTLNTDPSMVTPSYFMVQFIIKNESKYPMRNVKVRITDFTGREMVKYGVKHTVRGMSLGFGVLNKEEEYKKFDYNPTFDIATVSPQVSTLLYRTTYSPDLSVIEAHYNVEVIWDNGHLIHLVTLKNEGENLTLGHWEGLFNGSPINDNSCFKFGNE